MNSWEKRIDVLFEDLSVEDKENLYLRYLKSHGTTRPWPSPIGGGELPLTREESWEC